MFHLGTVVSKVVNIYLVSSEMGSLYYQFKGTDQISFSSELVLRYLRLPINPFSIVELFDPGMEFKFKNEKIVGCKNMTTRKGSLKDLSSLNFQICNLGIFLGFDFIVNTWTEP